MNSSKSAVWAVWAIAVSAVFVNFAYAFGLIAAGIEPDMNSLRFLAFSNEVANRSIANFDLLGIGYAAFTTLSNQFLHGNMMHLASNMLSLGLVGYALEKRFGAKALWLWFLVGGAFGTLVQWSVTDPSAPLLVFGASGGIMTIVGMYQVLYATRTIQWSNWGWCLLAFTLVLLTPNILAALGLMSDVITSSAQMGVVVHLASTALGWAVGFHLSRSSREASAEAAFATNWKQAVGYALLTVAIASGVSFAFGKSAPSLEQRFFKYENQTLVSKLSQDLKWSTEALDKALQAPEVAANLAKVQAGVKEMDNQAQLYVHLKTTSGDEAIKEANVVRHFMDALKTSNIAAKTVIKLVEPEHKAFQASLNALSKAMSSGLRIDTTELDLVVAPVMEKLGPVNQAQSFMQAVFQATEAILTPLAQKQTVTRQMEMQAIFQVVTNYLDSMATQNQQ
ncbi:MAG: rhomboid family intramembrane serine protease [Candidatus Melainabacteria bacterium]|nr:MAG: rhomboid family intramembrane serine protease [Candidatus Melainabacteria bacterium]